jgi:hypothetical protein
MCSIPKTKHRANLSASLWLSLAGGLLLVGCQISKPAPTQSLMDATTPGDRTAIESPSTAPADQAVVTAPATSPMEQSPMASPAPAPAEQTTAAVPAPMPTDQSVAIAPPAPEPTEQPIAASPVAQPEAKAAATNKPARGYDPVQNDPPADAGSIARHWPESTSHYANGAAVAYPNYKYEKDDQPKWLQGNVVSCILDPDIVVLQSIETPFWMIFNPPWNTQVYPGVTYPPTQTGAPPMPEP